MALLEARGLTKRFGGLTAVAAVDLTVEAGEIVSVIGPNGAGKTTLFELVSGNLRPDAGVSASGASISWASPARDRPARSGPDLPGEPRVREPDRGRERPGGAHTPDPLRSARRAPAAAGRRAGGGGRARRALAALELFGSRLVPRADDFVITLSFANRRRTEIARALAAAPALLLLDEPAAGMNPSEKREIAGHIRDIRARGHTVLLIEHHMQTVMDISDRVVVLDHGEKIAEGPPGAIREDARVVEAYLGRGTALRRPRRPDA